MSTLIDAEVLMILRILNVVSLALVSVASITLASRRRAYLCVQAMTAAPDVLIHGSINIVSTKRTSRPYMGWSQGLTSTLGSLCKYIASSVSIFYAPTVQGSPTSSGMHDID